MFRTSAVSLQQNDLIHYDHTTKDLLILLKNSYAAVSMIQLSLKDEQNLDYLIVY